MASKSSEVNKPAPAFFGKNKIAFYRLFFLSLEILPLMVFIVVRAFGLDMSQRIFIAGGISFVVFAISFVQVVRFSPPYFATNLFFVFSSFILLLPYPALSNFFLDLGEVGMFLSILIVGFVWHFTSANGLLTPMQISPKNKLFSWVLLTVFMLCPFLAQYFKGNENLAGGLPFIIIVFSEKLLSYFQAKKYSI